MKIPRVVVAGQMPPPYGGQNVMVEALLRELRAGGHFRVDHLKFQFTPSFKNLRKGSVLKLIEAFNVLLRLLGLRLNGAIDVMIYPSGGPQLVPLLRDILLLPFMFLAARRVIIQFHAAGVAERFSDRRGILFYLIRLLYSSASAAIVMTDFNRRDPQVLSLGKIYVIPHRIEDQFQAELLARGRDPLRLFYAGHLCPDKGTPTLLEAFSRISQKHLNIQLHLAGECLTPFTQDDLQKMIVALGLTNRVHVHGVVTGEQKWRLFGQADVFVFPSIAPYESFGLVMAEAMMWGLPLVVSDWRGNLDVAGRGSGVIFYHPETDPVLGLFSAMDKMVSMRSEWKSMGEENRRRFEGFFCRANSIQTGCEAALSDVLADGQ